MKTQSQLVDEFAQTMKDELINNHHKGDWRDWREVNSMRYELDYHIAKLDKAIFEENKETIKEHLADCANFLLMIGNAYKLY